MPDEQQLPPAARAQELDMAEPRFTKAVLAAVAADDELARFSDEGPVAILNEADAAACEKAARRIGVTICQSRCPRENEPKS